MYGLDNFAERIYMKNIDTKFPNGIDDRAFMQDINIEQVPIMNKYYSLLSNGNYTQASELLNKSEVYSYGAWCLNLIENRLNAIGNYLKTLEEIKLVTYSETEPSESELYDGMTWIG